MEEIKKDWRDIFRAFRMAFDPKKLMLAVFGIVSSLILVAILLVICNRFGITSVCPKSLINNVLFSASLCPYEMLLVFCKTIMAFNMAKLIAAIILVIGLLIIWSIIGGALTRISALEYAKDDSLRLKDVLRFSVRKFWSYFWSPIVPALGVILFAVINVLGGFIGKFGVLGHVFVAFGFPLALLSSLMIAFIGVIGIIGLCLMFPTISAEGTDAFDAMSRAYSYVLSKPRKYICYFFVTTVFGVFSVAFVSVVACFVVNITFETVGIGMGQNFKEIVSLVHVHPNYCSFVGTDISSFKSGFSTLTNMPDKLIASSILACLICIKVGIFGFAVAYLASAKTIVYFLIRKDVDETDVSDVYIENEGVEIDENETTNSDNNETPKSNNSDSEKN